MADIYQFPRHDRDPRPIANAEGVLVKAISVVQRAAPPDSGMTRDHLLDELLEVLDGPEALEVYNRSKIGTKTAAPVPFPFQPTAHPPSMDGPIRTAIPRGLFSFRSRVYES